MVKPAHGESVVSRVVRIVETFGSDTPALRVSDVARRAGLHVATASRLIDELSRHGWLERDEDRRVRVGVRLWELASRASPTLGLREAAMPFMEDLHAVVGHHTQLGVRQGREVLFVERLSAPNAVLNITRVAGRLPLHVSSSGLVLLAHAPAEVQEEVLAGPLKPQTGNTPVTVTDPARLRRLLADVRRDGYVVCRGFIDEETAGVAVPVRGPGEQVLAALSVIVPNDRNTRAQVPALRAAARGVSRVLSSQ
ncbi:IclR family transcriptional regulator [Amycolatopsis sp. YIM 10]|uniref:IclR family transcriptional regulator n=1 Tax=Amycolatopsis sp. YIM 10 TaxID=2653857 RepID=UPI00129067C2|nr:IclR family transcriptional regulator [Amycolatopsis sp. YIM 10]QFU92185.1 HTH-type transcriptional regulator KipR [Amycolatopsis sp. YIM 10]